MGVFYSKLQKTFSNSDQQSPRKMDDIMVKLFVLTICTLVSTYVYTAFEIMNTYGVTRGFATDNYNLYHMSYIPYFIFGNVDMMVSAAYVLLTFNFTQKYYDKYCNCAHRIIKRHPVLTIETEFTAATIVTAAANVITP